MNVRKPSFPPNTIDSSFITDSLKKRPTMTDKHLPPHCVPDDNEDLMILAECALHTGNSPAAFMAVPSSPSSLSSPGSYPPTSPMVYPSSPSPAEFYDSHPIQVEFTKDFIITVCSFSLILISTLISFMAIYYSILSGYIIHPLSSHLTNSTFKLQSCIEKCLQEQLTMEEACTTIYYQFAIDPRVTEIGMKNSMSYV